MQVPGGHIINENFEMDLGEIGGEGGKGNAEENWADLAADGESSDSEDDKDAEVQPRGVFWGINDGIISDSCVGLSVGEYLLDFGWYQNRPISSTVFYPDGCRVVEKPQGLFDKVQLSFITSLKSFLTFSSTLLNNFFVTGLSTLKFTGHPTPLGNSPLSSFTNPSACRCNRVCASVMRVGAPSRGVSGGGTIIGSAIGLCDKFVLPAAIGMLALGIMRMRRGKEGRIFF